MVAYSLAGSLNTAPVAVNDAFTVISGTTASISAATLLANDTDADIGDILSIVSVGQALNGQVTFANGIITFTPILGYAGLASFAYVISDGFGGTATANVSVTIAPNIITGTAGADTLTGGSAADLLYGLNGNDILLAGSGADTLDGGLGADTMTGGSGDDLYIVDNSGDVVREYAGEGIDTVQSSVSYKLTDNVEFLTLTGGAAINATGNALANTLIGNSAANRLDGGLGADTMKGGAGNDIYIVDNSGDTVVEKTGEGYDEVYASVSYTLADNVEAIILTGTAAINATGNALGNTIRGNSAANRLEGGLGNDAYTVDNIGDVVVEAAGGGQDWVYSSVSYTLSANVEILRLTGTAAINGTGNELDNYLGGNIAANRLEGGLGNDGYFVDNAGDVVVEAAGAGTDRIETTVSYALSANVENLILMGTTAIDGTGNELDNQMFGNSAANMLDGRLGADVMVGGAGDDVYIVDNVRDEVWDWANEGVDTVRSSVSYGLSQSSEVENLTLTGAAAINATGNKLANTLIGNNAANRLDGGVGADTMKGGAGNDTYIIDNSGDSVVENASEGYDEVYASVSYTLADNVEAIILTGTAAINATGNALGNTIKGNSAANRLEGGLGDDAYTVDNIGDVVVEAAGGGLEWVYSSVSYTLSANVEILRLTGTAAINGTGNELDNYLGGNIAANRLEGGLGNDGYSVDNAGDVVVEAAGAGTDRIETTVSYTLSANVEELVLSGAAAIDGTGNELDNKMFGNSAANTFDGGLGADVMFGGAGDDVYIVDNVRDQVWDWANAGVDTVRSSVSYGLSLSAEVENLTLTGGAAINATGNALANTLIGNSAANRLDGGRGNDWLTGGADVDKFVFRSGYGADVVTDFAAGLAGTDVIELSLGANYDSLAEVLLAGTQVGMDTVFTFTNGDVLTLQNVMKDSLVANDFSFL